MDTLTVKKPDAPEMSWHQPQEYHKPNEYSVSVSDAKVWEGDTAYVYVRLDGYKKADHDIKINYKTDDGSAKADKDYYGEYNGHVTINKGSDYAKIAVDTKDDHKYEGPENFFVKIWEYDKHVEVKDYKGEVTIKDDDKPPHVSIDDVKKYEGDHGLTHFVFKVSVKGEHDDLYIKYHTEDGTAKTSDKDYIGESGKLHIGEHDKSGYIVVDVKGDYKVEKDEFFKVVLDDGKNYDLKDAYGIGVIKNDDYDHHQPSYPPYHDAALV
jgi:hypothetical protein